LIRRREALKVSEAEKPKRKFWQFHLSTAVILIIVAGGLIGVNLTERMPHFEDPEVNHELFLLGEERIEHQYGWPMIAEETVNPGILSYSHILTSDKQVPPKTFCRWEPTAIATNAAVALSILIAFGFCAEFLIRRREDRKT
jgi:hypothetical protein